ncbi:MAG TPA: hypothetical protein ACFE0H_10245 [Elainellaceae cyanobacterium]
MGHGKYLKKQRDNLGKLGIVFCVALLLAFGNLFQLEAQAQSSPAIATFDLNADLSDPNEFYNLPYPSDFRLDADGHPDLSGFPVFTKTFGFFKRLKTISSDRPAFPTTAAGYFRFNQPLASLDPTELIAADPQASILLVDIGRTSPERGRLFPVVATNPTPDPFYVPKYLLAVSPYPGIVLKPNRQYAYVIRRSLKSENGQPLQAPKAFEELRQGLIPSGELKRKFKAYLLYKPLWETLDQLEINRNSVVAATVFTTGDVVAEMAQLSNQVLEHYDPSIKLIRFEPEKIVTGLDHCKFLAEVTLPQFQRGIPPFLFFEKKEGLFEFDNNGRLQEQRKQTIPVVITLPKKPMPKGGYPLMVYYHGSGGLSTQVVDRGPVPEVNGKRIPGRGPADVIARRGFASVGSALPLNPERIPVVVSDFFGNRPYLNPTNPSAYRDTFRQGVIEQRLLLKALEHVRILPEQLGSCSGPSLPATEKEFWLNTSEVTVLGQSQGAQYAAMMGAVEPRIKAVVPTGSGGFWALLFSALANSDDSDFQKIADVLSQVLKKSDPLDQLYPALRLLQSSWEAAEPMVYMPRISKRPLPGHSPRAIYQPVGKGDRAFPEEVFDAVALATGVQQAGPVLWPEMQDSLALEGLDGIVSYPVSKNLTNENGTPYTGVVVQYEGDGLDDPHTIFSQLDDVKFQYGCFIESVSKTGTGVVSKAKPVLLPCSFP